MVIKFHLVHFVGVQTGDTTVGVEGTREWQEVFFRLPLPQRFLPAYWNKLRSNYSIVFVARIRNTGAGAHQRPMFRAVPITANVTAITNLSPDANRNVPAAAGGTAPANAATPAPVGGSAPVGGAPPRSLIRTADLSRPVLHGKAFRDNGNIDAWHWKLQGQGPGSIIPTGENAYSGLIGDPGRDCLAGIPWHI